MQRAVLSSLKLATLAWAALTVVTPAWALYKVVGPDGKVTYTDRPPSDKSAQQLKSNGATVSTAGLPYELQRIVSRYPVTQYSSSTCAACDAGRQLLKARGIPFVEKTVVTGDDIKALSKQENTDQLPVLRIGSKQMLGFNSADWAGYLDAAGYPAKSALPLNYQWPEKTPLAPPVDNAKPDSKSSKPEVNTPEPAVNPEGNGATPPGFRF